MYFRLLRTALALSALLLLSAPGARAANLTVLNYSFEDPGAGPYSAVPPTSWTAVQPNPPQIGLFGNPTANSASGDHISAGLDGVQAVFLFPGPGVSLSQTLAATYQVGQSYQLTIALNADKNMTLGTTLELRLYYPTTSGTTTTMNTIASTQIVYTQAFDDMDPGEINTLFDYSVNLGLVKSTDAWAGKPIGIEIAGISGTENGFTQSGYFDLDNVRLVSVPEPGAAGLLALGVAGWGTGRRRRS